MFNGLGAGEVLGVCTDKPARRVLPGPKLRFIKAYCIFIKGGVNAFTGGVPVQRRRGINRSRTIVQTSLQGWGWQWAEIVIHEAYHTSTNGGVNIYSRVGYLCSCQRGAGQGSSTLKVRGMELPSSRLSQPPESWARESRFWFPGLSA